MPALRSRLLAIAVAGVASAGSGCGEPAAVEVRGQTLRSVISEYRVAPQNARVTAGRVTVVVTNEGTMVHRLQVRSEDRRRLLGATPPLRPGERARITLELAPGTYVATCPQERHHTLGEHGEIVAE